MNAREENLSQDEQRVAELIGMLRHVDAPGDFDTRVRSRIAAGRRGSPHSSWRPILAGVAAVAILALAGYLGLRSFNSPGFTPTHETANTGTVPTMPVVTDEKPVVQLPATTAPRETAPAIATTKQPTINNESAPVPRGGSIDEAAKDVHRPFTKDYVPSQHRPNDNSGLGTAEIPVTMILDGIGVHASWTDTGWRVGTVNSNSVGSRTGLRPGDVIESIDGQMLSEKTSFKGAFSGKSIRVLRNGAELDLAFKP